MLITLNFAEEKEEEEEEEHSAVNPTGHMAKLERPHDLSASLTQSPNRKQSTR